TSDRWLTAEEVNKFKDEVKSHPIKGPAIQNNDTDDWEDIDTGEELGTSLKCVERWRNAGPEERKKMFALFEESGIFIASCRHRAVLLICDMIKSGELAKYGLAVIDRLIDLIGKNIGCAYDIGCAFNTTIQGTSISSKVKEANLRLMCGAFHGHAHNRLCQLCWHPLYIKGTGHLEGEGCQYLANHYREAAAAVKELEIELKIVAETLGIGEADFKAYFLAEQSYLESLKTESPTVTLKAQYVKALNDLFQCRKEWQSAREAANAVFTTVAGDGIQAAISRVHRRVDTAYELLRNAEQHVETIENGLGIQEQWTADSADYKEYHQQNIKTSYSKALDELERLVVMRLFELTKMSSSGTGYKLRRHIGKALQRHSEAIRNALNWYNTQAANLNPPRPALSWKEIVDYSFLGEFDLLRHSRSDIRDEPWAQPARREATLKYFKLQRAREEIVRLNMEIRRLRTWIRDETNLMEKTISRLEHEDPLLCAVLKHQWALRNTVNLGHLQRLDAISKQAYFSGDRSVGAQQTSNFSVSNRNECIVPLDGVVSEDILAEVGSRIMAENEAEYHSQLEVVTDFVLNLNN
ncbi:hypothetical protein C0992_001989, partial [Termitomyces sp. T32_za158]